MTEAFKRLNHANEVLRQDNENLINEKGQMLEHISILQDCIKILHYELSQQTQQPYETQIVPKSSPFSSEIDKKGVHSPTDAERPTVLGNDTASSVQTVTGKDSSNSLMGVHSPMNAERPTVSGNDSTSPVQTVTGKDAANPLMADTLQKSVGRILPASFKTIGTQTLEEGTSTNTQDKNKKGFFLRRKKSSRRNIEQMVADSIKKLFCEQPKEITMKNPKLEPRSRIFSGEETRPRTGAILGLSSGNSDKEDPKGEDDYNSAMDQFAQDPNSDDDLGMSFDTEELHNLDTYVVTIFIKRQ